jgi:polyisoprenoid-binding protein YceI
VEQANDRRRYGSSFTLRADSLVADAESIVLDATNTRVSFTATWFGTVPVRGSFERLHGTLLVPTQDVERAELSLDVEASSVATGVALRDHHLAGKDFLDSSRHPLISFRSDDVQRKNGLVLVSGTLSLRGVERRVTTECALHPSASENGVRPSVISLTARLTVPRRAHLVGVPSGLRRLDPLFQVIGNEVEVTTELLVPSAHILPALLPALGR